MAKYVTDGFRDALIKRAYQFCNGENDCSINPEIALAYLDAAEVLGADPDITINNIRKEAKTKLSSVEDKNAFWKDEPQDEGFADQLGSLGINICGGLSGYERDEKVGKTLMIAAATAGYNDYNMIGRVAGIYTGTFAFADPDLADLWNQRSKSYKAAEKSKAEERRAREHPQKQSQDPKEESKPFTAMKSSMLSSQERESEIREKMQEKMQEFAEKSLSMDPTDFSRAFDGISDKETECLIKIYDGYRSDPSKKSQEFTVALNMTLASKKMLANADETYFQSWPARAIYIEPGTFPKGSDWMEWRKEYEQYHEKPPLGTEQEYKKAYKDAKASFEKARERYNTINAKNEIIEDRLLESFGKLSSTEQLLVLDSLARAKGDSSPNSATWKLLDETFEDLIREHAKQIGQIDKKTGKVKESVRDSVRECTSGWPPRIPEAYRSGEIKKVNPPAQQQFKKRKV